MRTTTTTRTTTSAPHDRAAPAHPELRIDIGIVVWVSFLTACIATMVFFAFFDPLLLANDDVPPRWLRDRMTGYAVGFFFCFWLVSGLASALTAVLIESRPQEPPPIEDDELQ
jgi:hypothetical protein